MKRRFTILTAAFALLAFLAIPMGMKGQTTHTIGWGTASGDAGTYTNFTATSGQIASVLSFSSEKNSSGTNPAYNANASELRLYYAQSGDGGSITITPVAGVTITDAVMTTSTTPSVKYYVNGGTGISVTASNNTYTISDISATTSLKIQNANTSNTQLRIKTIELTYTTSGSQPTTYTVTYHANVTGIDDITETYTEGEDVPVADNSFSNPGYAFSEWNTEADGSGDSYSPEDVIEDIDDDLDLYAQWEESNENTATLTATNLELTGSYTTNTEKTIDDITYVFTDLMLNNSRIQAKATTGTIKNSTAYPGDIISVAITHDGTARATTINGSADGTNWTQVATGSGSITADFLGKGYKYFQITRGSNAAYWTKIEITYSTSSSSLDQSDLAIASPTGDLTFDLYNNTTAQVISYTTSSTGAITITPAESIYFSYVHDATAKTITVTPLAVTPSAQTVTIDQEADDNYYGGTATFTVSVVNSDPNLPGTENNPYTVAQARAAIDANMGTQNVYATGIVSAIPTAYNSTYGNITFNMVDETGDEVFLQAYRCGGDEAANVTVGDVAVVYGDLTKYGSTYEFGQGCQVVSLTHPVITEPTITVNPDVVDVDGLLHLVQLPITYSNIVVENYQSFGVQFYDAEGEETEMPDWLVVMVTGVIEGNDDEYVVTCAIPANQGEAHSTYLKVYAYDAEQNVVYSNLITISQAAPTYAELPFAFNGGKADIEGTDGLYQEGLDDYSASTNPTTKLKFDGTGDYLLLQFNERPGTLTFDIKNNSFSGGTFKVQTSENGVTFTDLKTYTEIRETQNEEFTNLGENVRYIKWIYTEKVSGNVGLGNIALAEYTEPQQYTLTVEPFENLELITFVNEEMVMEGDGEITVTEGDEIMLSVVALEGYEMETLMVNGENHVDDIADDFTYTFEMPGENVTISATAVEDVPVTPGTWVLTDLADLTENDVFVIVGDNGDTYAMPVDGGGQSGAPAAVAVTVVEGTLSGEPAANLQWNISITEDGYTFYPNGETETWLYCTNTNNGVRVGTGDAKHFTLDEGYLTTTETSEQRYIGIYNSQDWRCYKLGTDGAFPTNIADQTFAFYKKVAAATETYTLDIIGYEAGSDGGYYLIASPVTVDPSTIGMTAGEYDLYSFDQAEADEWRNYKQNAFNLEPGKGYLYAKQATEPDQVFHFELTGTPYNGNGVIELTYDDNAVDFQGWNLVGNPWGVKAYPNHAFYTMAEGGAGIDVTPNVAGTEVAAMTGIFVVAEGENETVTFATENSNSKNANLALNLTNSDKLVDRAIVRFGEGRQLPKFQLNPNHTKIYMPVDGKDYAIINADEMGEMPVSFKAENDGTYTFSVNAEEVSFAYLHLIDNMTGNDIDLLSTPSYSFEARTTDYANRFRLVFSANDIDSDNFAFVSNGQIIVNGNGMLQMFDMTGRMISSYNVNEPITTEGMAAGVYMIRLINGNDVKTQKIVVK